MKKIISALLASALVAGVFAGCASPAAPSAAPSEVPAASSEAAAPTALKKIVIGASPSPHAKILQEAAKVLKEQGYELEIKEFVDYVQPNMALENKELDANYFQHAPYLDEFNEKRGTHLVAVGAIHYEPFGIYAGKTAAIADLKEGAKIAVPNDGTNEARALLLLEAQGLIKLKEGVGLTATKNDIAENTKKLEIVEMEAAQLPRSLQDLDLAVINGNYAIEAGLKVTDALVIEDKDSIAADTYANIIAVRAGDEGREDVLALVKALQSDSVKKYMEDEFQGSVIPKA